MNALIGRCGGDGIVVSPHDCVRRCPEIRARLAGYPRGLFADFRTQREWSLVMAMTGVLNAARRGRGRARLRVVLGRRLQAASPSGPGRRFPGSVPPWRPRPRRRPRRA
ncbi:DUF6002 family protein [Kutzneria buriramensis]|uniref:DUF6002 family protein n=1 Tax=Kutzneria buriramensis TaxID=1045776 RepID=UPI0035EE282C